LAKRTWTIQLLHYLYFEKNKKINSHSTLRPIKNMKLRHFIWGFNEVSFEISTEYVRMYNFWPKELERYNYFIIYTMKKKKKKNSHSTLRPIKNMKLRHFIWGFNEVSFEISTKYECKTFSRKNLNDTIISLSTPRNK
jgi:hypothetical protein